MLRSNAVVYYKNPQTPQGRIEQDYSPCKPCLGFVPVILVADGVPLLEGFSVAPFCSRLLANTIRRQHDAATNKTNNTKWPERAGLRFLPFDGVSDTTGSSEGPALLRIIPYLEHEDCARSLRRTSTISLYYFSVLGQAYCDVTPHHTRHESLRDSQVNSSQKKIKRTSLSVQSAAQ